jgi:hypothetical protein
MRHALDQKASVTHQLVLHYIIFSPVELLENLKNQSSRRKFSPETSPRERLGASEISALRQKLVERDEAVKKFKAKNASYKERIEKLREKEMELTKALSLAEVSIGIDILLFIPFTSCIGYSFQKKYQKCLFSFLCFEDKSESVKGARGNLE